VKTHRRVERLGKGAIENIVRINRRYCDLV